MPGVSHDYDDNLGHQSLRSQTVEILDESMELVRREIEEISTEINAFEQFANRLDQIKPASPQRGPIGLNLANSQRKPVKQIQDAFRETVLSTPHFQQAYEESYLTTLRAEFGDELACALHPEDPAPFSPVLKQAVTHAVHQCIRTPSTLLENLNQELESLHRSRDKLEEFLDDIESAQQPRDIDCTQIVQLESIAASRQKVIHRSVSPRGLGNTEQLHNYLYSEKPWDFPVLCAIGRLRAASEEVIDQRR